MVNSDLSSLASPERDAIGEHIKRIRKERAFTLVQLSARSGVSRAALSKIERGEISPTYTTLRKIAFGLDLTIAALVSTTPVDDEVDIEIVRANEGKVTGGSHDGYRLLAGKAAHQSVRCFVSEVRARSLDGSDGLHTHNTEDVVFVLKGSVTCHFEGRAPIELNEGDSLFYRGNIPHAFTQTPDYRPEKKSNMAHPTLLWISMPLGSEP